MKIGMVTEFYYPFRGGISEHVRSLSLALRQRGHTVTVITGGMPAGPMEPGPAVVRLGRSVAIHYNGSVSRITIGVGLERALRGVLHDGEFDVLHVHNPLMPTLPYLALRHAACPVVATLHSGYPRDRLAELFRDPLRRLLHRATVLLCVSESARRSVATVFPGNYRIVPNGVDFEFFAGARPVAPDRPDASRPVETGDDSPLPGPCPRPVSAAPQRILFVGAAVPRKGLPVMLEAYRLLRERRGGLEFWAAGDGPLLAQARRSVPERLRDEVRFLGSCDRRAVRTCHALADLFCAPSLGRESFGMVLLEAMAAGVPVVASDIEGYAGVVDPGVDGLLVSPGDPVALAGAMDYLLADPGLRARLVRAGRRKAAGFRWERIAEAVESAYREACGQPVAEEPVLRSGPPTGKPGDAAASPRVTASPPVTVLGTRSPRERSSD